MNKRYKPEENRQEKKSDRKISGGDKRREGDKRIDSRKSRSFSENEKEKIEERTSRRKPSPKFFQPKDTETDQKSYRKNFPEKGGNKKGFYKAKDQKAPNKFRDKTENPRFLQPKDKDVKKGSGKNSFRNNDLERSSVSESNPSKRKHYKSADSERNYKDQSRYSKTKPFEKGRFSDKSESRKKTPYSKFSSKKLKAKDADGQTKAEKSDPNEIRLNRYIANAGVCSRRDADVLIKAGEITVNGKVVTEMGHKVRFGDDVRHNNRRLKREKPVYILVNKPKDFITTTDDPENRKTIMNLVESAGTERIYPVGRLDRNTTGLIIMTNDGELADKLSHPSNNVKKLYQVDLDKPITNEDLVKIKEGVTLEDGVAEVDDIAVVSPDAKSLGLQIHIGKNRIVRRIFEHLGYDVVKLDRVMYAGLDKKDLPRGKWRFLSEKEVIKLKYLNK
ncbi:pseudouridine synthase [soil metagenome]